MLYANYKEINENNGHILLECNSVSVTRKANMMINLNTNSEISLAQIWTKPYLWKMDSEPLGNQYLSNGTIYQEEDCPN